MKYRQLRLLRQTSVTDVRVRIFLIDRPLQHKELNQTRHKKTKIIIMSCVFSLLRMFIFVHILVGAQNEQEQLKDFVRITLNESHTWETPFQETRDLNPSCSGGPYIDPVNGTIRKFIIVGEGNKIVFIFGGGKSIERVRK